MLRFSTLVFLGAAWCGSATLAMSARPAHAGDVSAPAFSVRTLDGKTVRLSDFKGKPVVVDFWATWCQPCRASMPHLNAMQDSYGARGLVILGLSIDDQPATVVRRYASSLGIRFRLAMADDQVLDDYVPIRSIPTTIFINRRGEVVRRVVGYIDRETLETYIKEVL